MLTAPAAGAAVAAALTGDASAVTALDLGLERLVAGETGPASLRRS